MLSIAAENFRRSIRASGLTIHYYEPLNYIPDDLLEELLNFSLRGVDVKDLPPKTRANVVRKLVCEALGYPVEDKFPRNKPRFRCQDMDVFCQKALNLQIWNSEIALERRYAIVKIGSDDVVEGVRILRGEEIASFDKTGTLTTKYQARVPVLDSNLNLFSAFDTDEVRPFLMKSKDAPYLYFNTHVEPVSPPASGELLPIAEIFVRLRKLVGVEFVDLGAHQDRLRGAKLHALVCQYLGYTGGGRLDNGQFPDVRHQLLEIKLQTSPTIDLGLVSPDGKRAIDNSISLDGYIPRQCDVRYAIFTAIIDQGNVKITGLHMAIGGDFFCYFHKMEGRGINSKLQIPLSSKLFNF